MTAHGPEIRVFSDVDALSRAAGATFMATMTRAVAERGRCAVALAGGTTPRRVYETIARMAAEDERLPWSETHLFFGDERAVPPEDAESNYRMVAESMASRIRIPDENFHRIEAELGPTEAAERYEAEVRRGVGIGAEGLPVFDLILLGMGADGHTASLFPQTEALRERERLVVANRVPQLDSHRITFTFPVLNAARSVLFLVTGEGKAAIVRRILRPDNPQEALPAGRVRPGQGTLAWFLDESASSLL